MFLAGLHSTIGVRVSSLQKPVHDVLSTLEEDVKVFSNLGV